MSNAKGLIKLKLDCENKFLNFNLIIHFKEYKRFVAFDKKKYVNECYT